MLPTWPPGTPAVLCLSGTDSGTDSWRDSGPHAIPVSSYVRVGDDRILLALGSRREALARLRSDPATAFCVLAQGVAFTAHCKAVIVRESMEAAPSNTAVELRVERVQDHLADGRTEILDGSRWRWTDEEAERLQPQVLAELGTL